MSNEMIKADVGAIELTANGVKMRDVAQVFGFAELLGKAGMMPKGVSVEGAAVAIIAGASLGLNPFQAVQGIAVINGRPAIWGDAMVALVRGSGLLEDELVEYLPDARNCQGVRVTVKRKGMASPTVGMFSKTMAEKAGLWGKSVPWAQYPERMMLNRARAFAYRDAFADVLKGVRSAEEEQDAVDVVDAAPKAPRKRTSAVVLIEADEANADKAKVEVEAEAKADVKAAVLPDLA